MAEKGDLPNRFANGFVVDMVIISLGLTLYIDYQAGSLQAILDPGNLTRLDLDQINV